MNAVNTVERPVRRLRANFHGEPDHKGRLCGGCKINRFRLVGGRNKSAQNLAWKRGFSFRLYTRQEDAPRYWLEA